jgi:hypothetical protein
MPVTTRSQYRTLQQTSYLSDQPEILTSFVNESLTSGSSVVHLTSPATESLSVSLFSNDSTSLSFERSNNIAAPLQLPPTIPASTSLNTERLDHDIVSSMSSPMDTDLPLLSSLPHFPLEFQYLSESHQFEISKTVSLENFENCPHSEFISAHSISKNTFLMAEEGEESKFLSSNAAMRAQVNQDITDMNSLFASIKAHLSDATQQLSGDFRWVKIENDQFCHEKQAELDDLRRMLNEHHQLLNLSPSSGQPVSLSMPVPRVQTIPLPPSTNTISPNLTSSTNATTGVSSLPDLQSQMLLMLTESFAKLSTAITDKMDPKSEWPKFSGDIKKFRSWYLAIMAQLSLPPWLELYDASKNNIISTTNNGSLNGKLYSKILLALESSALQSAVSKTHLRANGLLLLHDLVQTYKPKNVPEVIAHKTGEFGVIPRGIQMKALMPTSTDSMNCWMISTMLMNPS